MSDLPDLEADEIEVRSGRTFSYSTVGEWVLLSPISDRAVRLYCLLRMHCNNKRGDGRAWPSQTTLAKMLGIKKRQEVAKAVQELVSLRAVEVEVINHTRGRRNLYVVHEAPPTDYDGHAGRNDYYAAEEQRASSQGVVPQEGTTPQKGTMGGTPQGDENHLKGKLDSKSFTRDKSLVSNTRARDEDRRDSAKDQSLFGDDPLPGQPPTVTAQTVTAAWVDANRANGYSPAKSRTAQVSRMAKELLAAGNDPDRVLAAAHSAGSKGWYTIDTELATAHRNGHRKPQLGTIDRRIAEFEAMKSDPDPKILARAGIPYPHPEQLTLAPGETP